MHLSSGFVADGAERLRAHLIDQIRTQVWAAHHDEWARASAQERALLRLRIERLIDERYREMAPEPDLYLLW